MNRGVAHADLVELREELVGRIARKGVGEARLDSNADEGEQPTVSPFLVADELPVAELHSGQLVRSLRMRLREVHRQIQVGTAGPERQRRSAG